MKHTNKGFPLTLILLLWCTLYAAAKTPIKGTVTDSQTLPLPGVSVVLKGTTVGTITDMNGQYTLSLDKADEGELEFSFIGMTTQDIPLHNQTKIDVSLQPETSKLTEVVVTGYGGTISRQKVTSSIESVKSEMLESGNKSNVSRSLSGAVAGLKVEQTTGRATSEPNIVLRGGTDLDGGGKPLIIVDGQVRSVLGGLNSEDIESMDVLKDAAATAIYGARANNGVILITTKRGKQGKSSVTLSTKQSLSFFLPTYDFLDAGEYLYWARKGVQNSIDIGRQDPDILNSSVPYGTGNRYFGDNGEVLNGNEDPTATWSTMFYDPSLAFLLDQGWKKMTDPITGKEIIYQDFNYQKEAIHSPSHTQEYNATVSGGNERGNYYAGIGYYKQNDFPIDTWYNRITFTSNGDYHVSDWLTSSSTVGLNIEHWRPNPFGDDDSYFGRLLSAPPTLRHDNGQGEPVVGYFWSDGNPNTNTDNFYRDNERRKMNFGQAFAFDLTENTTLRVTGGWYYDEITTESFDDDYIESPGVLNVEHKSSATYSREFSQTYNAVLTSKFSINDVHNIDFLVGTEYYDKQFNDISASGEGAPTGDFRDLDLTSLDYGKRGVSSSHTRERILSFMGRVNYDYQSKYLFSFIFREDGYSKLPDDNRWGFFPGVSTGWNLYKEDFVKAFLPSQINFLKLRASYGINGNVSNSALEEYTVQGNYKYFTYDGQGGYDLENISRPNIKWEKSHTFEVGIDAGAWDNRLNITATYYNRLTSDKLSYMDLPEKAGIDSILTNNGAVRNQGIELQATYRILDKGDWHWSVSANASRNKNVIVKLPYNGLERNRQNAELVYDGKGGKEKWVGGYQEGQEPGAMVAPVAVRILKNEEEVRKYANNILDLEGNNAGPAVYDKMSDADKKKYDRISPGDVLWKDINGDNIIDSKDKEVVGTDQTRWFGGLNTTVTFKGFTLFLRTDFATGHYQYNRGKSWYLGMNQGSFNSIKEVYDTWTPENPDAKYPMFYQADENAKHNYRESTLFINKSSYWAFRELSFSYQLPTDFVESLHFQSCNVNMSLQNLGYVTKSDSYNPEQPGTINYSGYPLPITYTIGASITL